MLQQHAKCISRGLSRSDHRGLRLIIIIIIITYGWRYVYYYYYYYTTVRPGERPVLRAIMPSSPNSFAEIYTTHTKRARARPPGDFNALVTCRDDAAAPRAIIAADSRAYLYYYYYIIIAGYNIR